MMPTRATLIVGFAERVEGVNRPSTINVYRNVIEGHIAKAPLGALKIQRVTADAIETYYRGLKRSVATVDVHHAVLCRAFDVAIKKQLIATNPMRLHKIERPSEDHDEADSMTDAQVHCWTADEARRFLAKADSTLAAAFFATALDTGARKAELYGLTWDRIDLDARTVSIDRQLQWQYGSVKHAPLKTGKTGVRTITLAPETVTLLRAHRASQAALKMKNRTTYADRGFVFAVEPEHQRAPAALGDPLTTLDRTLFKK